MASLGLRVDDVRILSPGGALVATWSGQRQRLTLGGATTLVYCPRMAWVDRASNASEPRWRSIRGPGREGGRAVIASIAPLRFGTWRGDALDVSNGIGARHRATAGHLLAGDGTPELVFEGALPGRVMWWLHANRPQVSLDDATTRLAHISGLALSE